MEESPQADGSVITALFRHNRWANLKLLDACAGLSDGQLGETAVGGFGALGRTLEHIIKSELSYVRRVSGAAPPEPLPAEGFPGVEALRAAAAWSGDELLKLALATRADQIVADPPHDSFPRASLMLQALNHSTEHRTQIATILTQLGIQPPEMDGWTYMLEHDQFLVAGSADSA
ncbi:MAG TPA: DinB family protein [Herpetosiphonaceae bacterium]